MNDNLIDHLETESLLKMDKEARLIYLAGKLTPIGVEMGKRWDMPYVSKGFASVLEKAFEEIEKAVKK